MPETRRKALIYRTTSIDWEDLPGMWIPRLTRQFSSDAGILAPLFLNIVQLEPGQAIFQAPGVLHAYLEGFGVELMANSDNVLRGGLTPKKIDVPELLRILDYNWNPPAIIEARSEAGSINWFFHSSTGIYAWHGKCGCRKGEVTAAFRGRWPAYSVESGWLY